MIARSLTQFALDAGLVTPGENEPIRSELEGYFRRELVIVRTEDELRAVVTQERSKQEGFAIYEKTIGRKRALRVSKHYKRHQVEYMDKESCCSEEAADGCCKKEPEKALKSRITCPHCGHVATEKMPTDVCLLRYTCKKCHAELHQQDGDCCVFCSYGDHKCPSKQE